MSVEKKRTETLTSFIVMAKTAPSSSKYPSPAVVEISKFIGWSVLKIGNSWNILSLKNGFIAKTDLS